MKGIILAGGSATRLFPATLETCKQLLPVYDKPMIYYPISTLMLADIRDILIISTPKDLPRFKNLFSDGSQLGIKFSYVEQDKPRGLADAFRVGKEFIEDDNVCLVLGDNIIHGEGLTKMLRDAAQKDKGATIFGYEVSNPTDYGVMEVDASGKVLSVKEKPKHPKSDYAVIGLYFFDNDVVKLAKKLKPSKRGEIEITSLINKYIKRGDLESKLMGRGFAWLDTGTFESLAEATEFIRVLQKRQNYKIGCIEEIAFRQGYIDEDQLKELAEPLKKSGYGQYLLGLLSKNL